MSSPLSNLKKGKKVPLGTRQAPYKPTPMSEQDLITQLNFERSIDAVKRSQKGEQITDAGLMSTLISRLTDVERKLGTCYTFHFGSESQLFFASSVVFEI